MKKINQKELNKILELHEKWLNNEKGGVKLDLSNTDLINTNLESVDLSYSDLEGANLSYTNLRNVDLRCANLTNSNLSCANLKYANLTNSNLSCADLTNANLRNAYLEYADLKNTDVSCADLTNANLYEANLKGANLYEANLSNANLSCADLTNAKLENIKYNYLTSFFATQCPEEGSFIGFKKANGKIVKLLITEDSLRSSATSRKCRCSKAKVLSITSLDGKKSFDKIESNYDEKFIYEVGKIVEVKDFDKNSWSECSTGIHFFITREEAVSY